MYRPTFLASLAVLPFVLAPAPAPLAVAPAPCPNIIVHEPLVMFDVNGGSLGGPIDIGLMVYSDGTARICSAGQFGQPSVAEFAAPGVLATHQLLLDLSGLGAGQLCDHFQNASDVPISTLTVFRNSTDTRNHTYSWDVGDGAYAAVQTRIFDFIHATFPNF